MPERGVPARPTWLSKAARSHWDQLAGTLDAMGVLTTADGYILALMAEALTDYRRARDYIEKHGANYKSATAHGFIRRANPEVAQAADAMNRFTRLATQFGLSPATRTKLTARPKETEDPLDELRSRRRAKSA